MPLLTRDDVLRASLADVDPELILYDGLDGAVAGIANRFGMEPVLAYDLEKVRQILMQDGGTFEEVAEHLDFNVLGMWAGDRTPVFVEPLGVVCEREEIEPDPCSAGVVGGPGCANPRGCLTRGKCLSV